MRTILVIASLFCALSASAKKDKLKLIHTGELAKLLAQDTKPAIFDANNEETRKQYGMIPGAEPLKSSKGYDVSVLPPDPAKLIVFYCANKQCMASHAAAEKAIEHGHTNVVVFADGIMGWKKAGKPTKEFKKSGG